MVRRKVGGPGIGSWSAWFPIERSAWGRATHDACQAEFLNETGHILKKDPAARKRIERLILELREAILGKMFK